MTKRITLALAALALPGAVPAQPAPPAPTRDPTVAERAYIAAAAYHAIKRFFAHAEALPPDYDFEGRYRAYLNEALAAPDRRSFSLATMRLFASLRNGHTGFDDDRLWAAPDMPFRVARVDGRWTVTASSLAALAPGDVIETVDGRPADEWLAPVRAEIGASSPAALDRRSWQLSFLFPRALRLGLSGGRAVAVDREAPPTDPERGRVRPKATEVIHRADGVIVIRIPSFDSPRFEDEAVAAVRSAAGARAILFDLRGNGGGSTPDKLLAAIMTRPYRGTTVVTPLTIAENDAHAEPDTLTELPTVMMRYGPDVTIAAPEAWTGRAAVLTDGGCASACEDFVLRFKQGGRGPVLGDTTYGSTRQPYFVSFPQFGMSFRVSTKRESFADGRPFEGVGVSPDTPVPLTRAELRRGTDDQLERAVRIVLAGGR